MKQDILQHQTWVERSLKRQIQSDELELIKSEHLRQLQFLQHERLVHLIVTMAVMLLVGVVGIACILHPLCLSIELILVILVILVILELFYLRHYYFLENTTQYWYRLYNQLIQLTLDKTN